MGCLCCPKGGVVARFRQVGSAALKRDGVCGSDKTKVYITRLNNQRFHELIVCIIRGFLTLDPSRATSARCPTGTLHIDRRGSCSRARAGAQTLAFACELVLALVVPGTR